MSSARGSIDVERLYGKPALSAHLHNEAPVKHTASAGLCNEVGHSSRRNGIWLLAPLHAAVLPFGMSYSYGNPKHDQAGCYKRYRDSSHYDSLRLPAMLSMSVMLPFSELFEELPWVRASSLCMSRQLPS